MEMTTRMSTLAVLLAAMVAPDATAAENATQLRKEMAKIEEQFFALYNTRNADRQFDVVCVRDTRTGTKFSSRVCLPRYQQIARARAASDQMRSAVAAGETTNVANTRGPNVGVSVGTPNDGAERAAKDEAFRKNMLEVLQANPDLQALGDKRDELQSRLNAASH